MASSTAASKSQPPKARKRITLGLNMQAAAAPPAHHTKTGNSDKDCVFASSPPEVDAKPIPSAKDASKAQKIGTSSKMTRKRRNIASNMTEMASKPVRAKKEKDPNEPKRPPTAFFLFMEEFRQTLKKENSNGKLGGVAVSKEGGEKWRALSAEAKEPYVKKCADMKEEYQKALKNYNSNGKDSIESSITDNATGTCGGVDESCAETAASPLAEQTSETEQ